MKRRLPPFAAIRAFEAAARNMSFKKAAEELCVTQSAISHQIKNLEGFLAAPLFLRHPHGIELTRAGRDYLREMTEVLDRLDASTLCLRNANELEPLRIRATPAFAARWLVPRMHRFYAEYPDIEWQLATGLPPTDFSKGDVDVVIHWGEDPVPGVRIEPFLESPRTPVASREFLRNAPELREPGDLMKVTLLHDEVQDGWGAWFRACGIAAPPGARGPRFGHCELVLTATEKGHGVALAYTALIETELKTGRLIKLFDHQTPPVLIYSLAYRVSQESSPKIKAFRRWIFHEIAAAPPLTLYAVGA